MNLAIFGTAVRPVREQSATMNCANGVRNGPPMPPQSLLARLETWLWQSRQRQLERHLAGCLDVFELEVRMRELERVPPHRRHE